MKLIQELELLSVAEATYTGESEWKQTSLSYEEACKKYGKQNCKIEGKNQMGQPIVVVKTSHMEEAAKNLSGYRSFEVNIDEIQVLTEKIRQRIAKNGRWAAKTEELGGDASYLNDANAALDKLEDAINDWHMSVGTAQQDDNFNPDMDK